MTAFHLVVLVWLGVLTLVVAAGWIAFVRWVKEVRRFFANLRVLPSKAKRGRK